MPIFSAAAEKGHLQPFCYAISKGRRLVAP
jgi:hypothetical protein